MPRLRVIEGERRDVAEDEVEWRRPHEGLVELLRQDVAAEGYFRVARALTMGRWREPHGRTWTPKRVEALLEAWSSDEHSEASGGS